MKQLIARYQASRVGRMVTRYGQRGGAVLAGGSAYAALFSIFGALVAGFAVFGLLLGNNPELLDQVVRATAESVPGLLTVDGQKGVIEPETLFDQPSLFSTAGIIAFAVALVSGLGWVSAVRQAIRVVADIPQDVRNIVLTRIMDVGWLASLGGLLVVAAVLSMGLTAVGGLVLDALGLDGSVSRLLIRAGGFAAVVLVHSTAVLATLRWLAGMKLPLKRLWGPALACGTVSTVLTQFSGVFLGSSGSRNPLLATGALLVTLLVLFNLLSRVVLYGVAWIASKDDPPPATAVAALAKSPADTATTEPVTDDGPAKPVAAPAKPVAVRPSTYHRILLAAGAVLGATAALGVSSVMRAVDALTGRSDR